MNAQSIGLGRDQQNFGTWFVFGIVMMILLAMYAPRLAGGVAILIALVLAMRASQAGLV